MKITKDDNILQQELVRFQEFFTKNKLVVKSILDVKKTHCILGILIEE